MVYEVHRTVEEGKTLVLSLGVPEVDAYLNFLKYRCRPNTWINYAHDLKAFLNAVQKPVLEVKPADIFAFIDQQKKTSPRSHPGNKQAESKPGLSNRTVRRRLTAISGFYEYLRICSDTPPKSNPVPRGLAARSTLWGNWFRSEAMTPLIRVPQTLPRPLDSEEITKFLHSLRTHRDKAMLLLMLLGGLRKSEVLGLTLKDVDFGQRTIQITDGKGGHQRVVAIAGAALQVLLRYMSKERPNSSSPQLFLVLKGPHKGQPLTAAALDTIVEYHREQAGTPGVQCHRLRHTCLTRLRQAGMSMEALQAQAGHKSMTSTRVYLHLCPRELQEEYLRVSGSLLDSAGREGVG